jgi:acyl-coenzyme A synthetase/AMP-(fatty) acid ligase
VDPDGNPVPDGTPGELVLSDRRIALGEWHAGTIVPGRMQPDPQAPSRRIFRTGDVMRLAPDGMLSFVGRADRQINVNGVRIEPGEIEAVLRAHPGVLSAAVVADAAGQPAAFVAAPGTADAPALRAALAARARAALPAAMRPAAITVLPALPMMPSGKIDLVALRRKATEG